MPKRILFHLILALLMSLPFSAKAVDLRSRLEEIIKETQGGRLCGEFIAAGGTFEKVVFGDGNRVVLHASGLELTTDYFIDGKVVFIKTDQALIELEIQNSAQLRGRDEWTKNRTYTLTGKPEKPCVPYGPTETEKSGLKNLLCYLSGVSLQKSGDLKGATERYLECCNSGDAESCNKYGFMNYLVLNNKETAIKYLRKSCDMGYGGGCSNLAGIEEKQGKAKEAKRLYEEACAKGFKEACSKALFLVDSFLERANSLLEKGSYDQAIAEFDKVIELDPNRGDAYRMRGAANYKKGLFDQAITDLSKAITLNPKDIEAFYWRGWTRNRKKEYGQALTDLDRALELNPKDAGAYYGRAFANYAVRHHDQAISDCSKALELEPGYAGAYHLRAICYYYLKEYDRSWADVRQAQKLGLEPNPKFLEALEAASDEPRTQTVEAKQSGFKEWTDPLTGMEFVWLPGGCFLMGSPESEPGRGNDEGPVHEVCLDGFWMGKYEVTNGQVRMFKPSHNSGQYKGFSLDGNKQPAVSVSLEEAINFTRWLGEKNGGRHIFRLPTEAEWEYACRAGTQTAWFWGDDPNEACKYANVSDLKIKEVWPYFSGPECNDGYVVSAPVGLYQPNNFGLYDIIGNVSEWCVDGYEEEAYRNHARRNPLVPGTENYSQVFRGLGWNQDLGKVRCAFRGWSTHNRGYYHLGFRVVRTK